MIIVREIVGHYSDEIAFVCVDERRVRTRRELYVEQALLIITTANNKFNYEIPDIFQK